MAQQPKNDDGDKDKSLPLSQVLEHLSRAAVLGPGLPKRLSSPPWRIPEVVPPSSSSSSLSALANIILDASWRAQSATVPDSGGEFDAFVLSNASLAVSTLVRSYLLSACPQIATTLVLGVLRWDEGARSGDSDYEGTPHLWLEIEEQPIDNAFVYLPEAKTNMDSFFSAKHASSYSKEDPFKSKLRLYLGQEGSLTETVRHNFRIYRAYANNSAAEKFVVLALGCAKLNPGVKMYDLIMRAYLKQRYGLEPEDLELKWTARCWTCAYQDKGESKSLKTCVECGVGRYCGKECQKEDWKDHKLLHKEIQLTKKVLAQDDDEEL